MFRLRYEQIEFAENKSELAKNDNFPGADQEIPRALSEGGRDVGSGRDDVHGSAGQIPLLRQQPEGPLRENSQGQGRLPTDLSPQQRRYFL